MSYDYSAIGNITMDNIKIFIADDHQIILDGIRHLLASESTIEIIGEALNGNAVLEQLDKLNEIDVLVMDINMPEKDGIEVTRFLKLEYPEIKILIMTMYNRVEFITNLMEVGVDGYILKNSGKQELLKAIHSVAMGDPYFGDSVTKTIMRRYQKSRVFNSAMEINITPREKEIIKLIAQGLSSFEMSEKLFLAENTINTHRRNILSKLNVKNSAGIIRFGIQTGIIKDFELDS